VSYRWSTLSKPVPLPHSVRSRGLTQSGVSLSRPAYGLFADSGSSRCQGLRHADSTPVPMNPLEAPARPLSALVCLIVALQWVRIDVRHWQGGELIAWLRTLGSDEAGEEH